MTLLDAPPPKPPSRALRYGVIAAALAAVILFFFWHMLRFHAEKEVVRQFLDAAASGQMQQAYQIWQPRPSYSFKDFLDDWGPDGYYGPVKSYKIKKVAHPSGGSGVIVTVEISPYNPFPAKDDVVQQSKTKDVSLWVEFKDHSIGFAP